MRNVRLWFLAGCCGVGLSVPLLVQAGHSAEPATDHAAADLARKDSSAPGERPVVLAATGDSLPGPASPTLDELWRRVRAAMDEGAYQKALIALDAILEVHPNDPWAELNRALCQSRLQSPPQTDKISAGQLSTLTQRLRLEERMRRNKIRQVKAMKRATDREQNEWDRSLDRMAQEAFEDEERQREEETARRQRVAVQRVEEQRRLEELEQTRREQIEQVGLQEAIDERTVIEGPDIKVVHRRMSGRLLPTAGRPGYRPSFTAPGRSMADLTDTMSFMERRLDPTSRPPRSPGVELDAVVVPAAPEALDLEIVEIDARQMRVSQERNLAIAEGDVEVRFRGTRLICDRMTLFTDTHDVYAEGNVLLEDDVKRFRADFAHYNFDTKKGRFLEGTASIPPWHQAGRWFEHLAEGAYRASPGYLTSCDLDPPHYTFASSRTTVISEDSSARARDVILMVDRLPLIYLPSLTFADRQSPFFIVPGKKKPWGSFTLMGYRYEFPGLPVAGDHEGTFKVDWREHFGWGTGMDHWFESKRLGEGLLKWYYNDLKNRLSPNASLPKGALEKRFRLLWRHIMRPIWHTSVVTDLQSFSDINYRKDFLFREEFVEDDVNESFISSVTSPGAFTLSLLVRKRVNRFQTITEEFPNLSFNIGEQRIGDSNLFSLTELNMANTQTKTANSEADTDVVRAGWFQEFSYALNWFRPVEVTPRMGVRQTYYTKDRQGGVERPQGKRDVWSGQFTGETDASLKMYRIFPVRSNVFGMNLNWLRHVLTPTLDYKYVHEPTVPTSLLSFPIESAATNTMTYGLENKLQTKRPTHEGKMTSVDIARFLISLPYRFRGRANKRGGRLSNWSFDLELTPWPWMRLETNWSYETIPPVVRDSRVPVFNTDLVIRGGGERSWTAKYADKKPVEREVFDAGPKGGIYFMPEGEWYLGFGHRYVRNSRTEDVIQFDWRLSERWQIGTFHRFTFKEVVAGQKRLNNLREYQYTLRRDLHDWVGELVYRVDREFGEELFLTITLKAYPDLPFEVADTYHEPKFASQSSPFSPISGQREF